MEDERAEVAQLLRQLDALVGRRDAVHAALAHVVDVLGVHVDSRALPRRLPALVHLRLMQRMRPDLHPRRLWVLGDVDEAGPGGKADEPLLKADLLALVVI